MNGQTVIEKTIPSGGTVRITIDDDGFVIIEGARRANIIYGFYFDGTGYHRDSAISLPGTENSDYIAIHTEHALTALRPSSLQKSARNTLGGHRPSGPRCASFRYQ